MKESEFFFSRLNEEDNSVHLEKDVLRISSICQRARELLKELEENELSVRQVVGLGHEMHSLDQEAVSWRHGPRWAFKTLRREELTGDEAAIAQLPELVQIHRDTWTAYEWNYHRTARILLHEQLLTCFRKAASASDHLDASDAAVAGPLETESITIIRSLADRMLATVPQSLGDIDHEGRVRDPSLVAPRCCAVGAYFLLWPMKVIKGSQCGASEQQKLAAQAVFERIREYTGAKLHLGDLSSI